MKKKIKPEDLQLREEILNGNISPNLAKTRNSCFPEKPLPEACDTTTTDHTFNGCTTMVEDKCDQSLIDCPTNPCHTSPCIQTQSDAQECCPLSDGKGDCNTTVCQVYPSVDICLVTEKNCGSGYTTCQETVSDCLVMTEECAETNEMCEQPVLTADCRTEFCAAP